MNEVNSPKGKQNVALLTGATGFIGKNLAFVLEKSGWQVHILCRSGLHDEDISESGRITKHAYDGSIESIVHSLGQAKPDVVFHLASLFLSQHTIKDVQSLIASNILLGNQLLEAMRINGVSRFVNTGTSWQHYENKDYNPVCLYAATKQAFEAILEYYVQACGIRSITLKLFDTYGANDPRPKLLNLLNKIAKSGDVLEMSPGEQLIDIVHVDDVTSAYMVAGQRLLDDKVHEQEQYAVSSGQPMILRDLVKIFQEVVGKTVNINWGARPYRFREVMISWDKGPILPDWSPKIGFADGLRKIING